MHTAHITLHKSTVHTSQGNTVQWHSAAGLDLVLDQRSSDDHIWVNPQLIAWLSESNWPVSSSVTQFPAHGNLLHVNVDER